MGPCLNAETHGPTQTRLIELPILSERGDHNSKDPSPGLTHWILHSAKSENLVRIDAVARHRVLVQVETQAGPLRHLDGSVGIDLEARCE